MRTLTLIFAAMMAVAAPVFADGPTTEPVVPPKVLIFPFQPMGQVKGHEWIQSALQEDIVSELNKSGLVQTHSMENAFVSSDTAKVIDTGKEAGADLVVFGSYQIVGDQIRVNAQMSQVSTGGIVAPLQATGITLDIFKIEDALAGEMQPALTRLYAPEQTQPVVQYGTPSNPINPDNSAYQSVEAQPSIGYVAPPSTVYVPTYQYAPYPYAYNYGYYPGVYFGGSVFYGSRFHGGFNTFNRGFEHRGFDSRGFGGRGFVGRGFGGVRGGHR